MGNIFSKILIFVSFAVICGAVAFAATNFNDIERWSYFRNYSPPMAIAELADLAGFNKNGREIFYFADPALKDKSEFNNLCRFPDKSLVLGCFTGSDERIYILDVQEPRLEDVEVVTAAHEMLHAAYHNLSQDDKSVVQNLITKELGLISDKRIKQAYEEYIEEGQEIAVNEMHSIIATEVKKLSPELESYYAQYFKNRVQVVDRHTSYRDVFIQLENQVANLKIQLDTLAQTMQDYKSDLDRMGPQIDSKLSEVNAYAAEGDKKNYYSSLAEYESLIADYNYLVSLFNASVVEYNNLVKKINNTALKQNDLVNSIDSKYSERQASQ